MIDPANVFGTKIGEPSIATNTLRLPPYKRPRALPYTQNTLSAENAS